MFTAWSGPVYNNVIEGQRSKKHIQYYRCTPDEFFNFWLGSAVNEEGIIWVLSSPSSGKIYKLKIQEKMAGIVNYL